jgi:hypothetical protein
MWDLPPGVEPRKEVVDGLCENACPVDGVDSTEMILVVEGLVGKKRLYDVLTET